MCTGWGLPGDCLGLGGAGGIFGPAVPIFRVPCCTDDVLFGLANVPEPILGVPGVTVPILGVPAPEILLSVEEGLVEVLLIPEPAGGRFEGLPALEGLLNGLQGEFALRALEAGFEGGLESCATELVKLSEKQNARHLCDISRRYVMVAAGGHWRCSRCVGGGGRRGRRRRC